MTQNQLKWFELSEGKRHNLVTEGVEQGKLSETTRHNQVTEGTEASRVSEIARHNLMDEGFTQQQIDESKRHNRAQEGIGWGQVAAAQTQASASLSNAATNSARQKADEKYQQQQYGLAASNRWMIEVPKLLQGERSLNVQQQNANTNALNAATGKLKADRDYSLGLWSNANQTTKTFTDLIGTVGKLAK